MPVLHVFDPPMCCSTGVCGPDPDDELVSFTGALRWLKRQGVTVERHNLGRNPDVFVETPLVYNALQEHGQDVLPLLIVDEEVISRGSYPSREELARWMEPEAA